MPKGGDVPKSIAYAFGGEDTMKVSSWWADSRQNEFKSNSEIKYDNSCDGHAV